MRWRWSLLAVLTLAGCVAGPSGGPKVAQVGGVSLEAMMPGAKDLDPGFHVGYQTAPDPTRIARTYDHDRSNATVRHTLLVSLTRADTFEAARAQMDDLRGMPQPDAQVRDEGGVRTSLQTIDESPGAWIHSAFGMRGLYVAMAQESAHGEPPLTNVTLLVRSMLDKAPDGP